MFIPRHPVIENQFCKYAAQTNDTAAGGVGGVIAYAGAVLYLKSDATNEESEVNRYGTHTEYVALGSGSPQKVPFGFSMQKVKTGYHQVHPTGYMIPGDLGSSDVIAQAAYDGSTGAITGTKEVPVGVAHLGIWDTTHYIVESGDEMSPGDMLYVAANAESKVTNSTSDVADGDEATAGKRFDNNLVARVLRGASSGKVTANRANTVLYPIRIKLMI